MRAILKKFYKNWKNWFFSNMMIIIHWLSVLQNFETRVIHFIILNLNIWDCIGFTTTSKFVSELLWSHFMYKINDSKLAMELCRGNQCLLVLLQGFQPRRTLRPMPLDNGRCELYLFCSFMFKDFSCQSCWPQGDAMT